MALALFAQGNQFNPPGNQAADQAVGAVVGLFYCGYCGLLVVGLALLIWMLATLSACLRQVRPRNRAMEPGQVWLNLIPFFNLVWLILTVLKVAESLRNEYEDRGLRGDGDFGQTIGITYYVSTLVCYPVGFVFKLIYRGKIAAYTRELAADPGRVDDGDDRDDRPRRRRPDDRADDDDRGDR